MAGSFTNTSENEVLDHVLAVSQLSYSASVWISLHTAAYAEDGSATEVTGGSYARLEVGGATGRSFTAATGGASSNNEEWAFTTATVSWGTILSFGVWTTASGGTMRMGGDLGTSKTIDSGDTAKFAAGELDVTLD
jgi:hypothetical protein